ncbi:MAG: VanW family protein [Patescibacteria group bacterium]|nr:VanW family protein [Patescibacteria group bacterium]
MAKEKQLEHKKNKLNLKLNKKIVIKLLPFLLLVLILVAVTIYNLSFENKIVPGVKFGSSKVDNATLTEIEDMLIKFNQDLRQTGIVFSAQDVVGQDKILNLRSELVSLDDPDLTRTIIQIDIPQTLDDLYDLGHEDNFFQRLKTRLSLLFHPRRVDLVYQINSTDIEQILEANFNNLVSPAQDAQLIIDSRGNFQIQTEQIGYNFDHEKAQQQMINNLNLLKSDTIYLTTKIEYPRVKKNEAIKLLPTALKIVEQAPLILTYQNLNWKITDVEIKDWLKFDLDNYQKTILTLDKNKVEEFLKTIAVEIDIQPHDAKFVMENERVLEFQASLAGRGLDVSASYAKILEQFLYQNKNSIELIVVETQPKIAVSDVNNVGIQELIGRGESDFSGSPQNRIHNIQTGAQSLNGLLIKPDEEFSLIQALGEINAESGYLPELVIRGDRTIPEYGGGLCQIGTTAFRVALNTGLPVTERQPHSYRVSYYEPAGTDATIYNPSPDLKFINDTGNNILWLTRVEGTKLTFEFWGTNDGRKVEVGEPRIFNITSPGPTKIIETEDLPPDEQRCIERAHNGADAEFKRVIIYFNGEVKEETWSSHYKAWPEVCLVGKQLEEEITEGDGGEGNLENNELIADEIVE